MWHVTVSNLRLLGRFHLCVRCAFDACLMCMSVCRCEGKHRPSDQRWRLSATVPLSWSSSSSSRCLPACHRLSACLSQPLLLCGVVTSNCIGWVCFSQTSSWYPMVVGVRMHNRLVSQQACGIFKRVLVKSLASGGSHYTCK